MWPGRQNVNHSMRETQIKKKRKKESNVRDTWDNIKHTRDFPYDPMVIIWPLNAVGDASMRRVRLGS